MSKRPLCAAAVFWAVLLYLLGGAGIKYFTYAPPELPSGAFAGKAAVTGEVYRADVHTRSTSLYLRKANLILNSKKYPIDGIKATVTTEHMKETAKPGSEVLLQGELQEIPLPSNPGQFHERAYYYPRKIKWYQKVSYIQVIQPEKNRFLCLQEKIKQKLQNGIYHVMTKEQAGIMEAMLLGEKAQIDTEQQFLFQLMGCSHILSVSGTHLSVIGGVFFWLLRKLRIPYKAAGGITVAAMFFYGSLTGNGAAVLRAVVMFAVSMGAFWVRRTYDFLSAMALASMLLLAESPLYLYDSSFLLSFGAIWGLGAVYPVLFPGKKAGRRRESRAEKLYHGILAGIQSGISVWLVLLPVTMYFFYEIPLWGIFMNLLILPTAGILLASGILGCVLGVWFPVLGKIAAFPAAGILELYLQTGKITAGLPGALWITGQPKLWKCALYYVLLVLVLWLRKRGLHFSLLLAGAMTVLLVRLPQNAVEVTFLDVGQGDCACIQTGIRSGYLVDGGSSSVSGVGKYRILPFLKASGISRIKGVFVSHMDADHINGIQELLETIAKGETMVRVERLFLSACRETEEQRLELEKLGKAAGCEIIYAEKGTKLQEDKMEMDCLSPSGENWEEWESNEASQVWKFQKEKFVLLFTGDTQERGEESLFKETGNCQVLKVAHHGSKNSTPEVFLQEVQPEIAIISCGAGNRYGHPHKELVERLKRYTGKIYNTAECGAVRLQVKKEKIKISCYRTGDS